MSAIKIVTRKPIVKKIIVGTPIKKVTSVVGKDRLNQMDDVNVDNLTDKSVLVWNEVTQEWTATPTLDGQIVEGGGF